jgi:hypothetical protein
VTTFVGVMEEASSVFCFFTIFFSLTWAATPNEKRIRIFRSESLNDI